MLVIGPQTSRTVARRILLVCKEQRNSDGIPFVAICLGNSGWILGLSAHARRVGTSLRGSRRDKTCGVGTSLLVCALGHTRKVNQRAVSFLFRFFALTHNLSCGEAWEKVRLRTTWSSSRTRVTPRNFQQNNLQVLSVSREKRAENHSPKENTTNSLTAEYKVHLVR